VKGGRESGKVPSTRAFARRQTEPGFFQDDSQDDDAQEAYPYFAILHADGDQMGKLLNGMKTPDAHREFSQTLAKFATDAKEIVARHDGYAVYTGGDDVLAFLPVRTAVECARELAKTFQEAVGATLSAGVAVCHYRQPLSLSREAVQRAEKRAKNEGNRNALCLALHTRGGQPLFVTRKWADWARFETWTGAFRNGSLTRGVAYELRELAKEFQEVENVPSDLLELEAKRIWSRKQSESKEKRPDFPAGMASNVEALKAFADMLVAARFLTEKETR